MAKKSTKNKAIENALNSALNNAEIKAAIEDVMENEVLEVVKWAGQNAVMQEVYEKYDPEIYSRRMYDGGLLDEDNWVISSGVKDMSMTITNVTPANPYSVNYETRELEKNATTDKNLPYLIVSGYAKYPEYDFPVDGAAFMKPRDFISKTAGKITRGNFKGIMLDNVASGLSRHGFTVKLSKR